jgi:hypothetical protein
MAAAQPELGQEQEQQEGGDDAKGLSYEQKRLRAVAGFVVGAGLVPDLF